MNGAFAEYTHAALSFRMAGEPAAYETAPCSGGATAPILRRASAGGRCVLLGVGTGSLARSLLELLPRGGLTVCELYPDQARAFGEGLPLLADGSATTLAWLLFCVGLHRGPAFCVLNPEIAGGKAKARFQALQRLHAAFEPFAPPGRGTDAGRERGPRPGKAPQLTAAAILHPGEPDLAGFFAALPACASEAVVVWDAKRVPANMPAAPIAVRHLAHALQNDFAAQRNRMLAACETDWVLYLDGDERLEPALEAMLPALTARTDCRSFAFPRLAVTRAGVKIGWGLWPDLQVRLFRRGPGVRFTRPVHERLEGVGGPTGLVVGASIRHLSDVLKSPEELARKHALFDKAAGGRALHRQNAEYPLLPEEFFARLTPVPFAGSWPPSVAFAPL
jgi:hypothetical protein